MTRKHGPGFDPLAVSPDDAAYAAGLFEGEGSVGSATGWTVRVGMTDREPLDRMAAIFGGRVTGPYRQRGNRKPSWAWSIHGYDTVAAFFDLVAGRLSPRRLGQFGAVLSRLPQLAPVSGACGRDTVAGYAAHRARGEPPCVGCRDAWNRYHVDRGLNRRRRVAP